MVLKDGEVKRPMKLPFKVETSPELTESLANLLGAAAVKVQ
jgi:hypothetical protein